MKATLHRKKGGVIEALQQLDSSPLLIGYASKFSSYLKTALNYLLCWDFIFVNRNVISLARK